MRRGTDYWVKLVAFVTIGLLLSSIAGDLLGGGAGIAVLLVYIVIGRIYIRPYITGRR